MVLLGNQPYRQKTRVQSVDLQIDAEKFLVWHLTIVKLNCQTQQQQAFQEKLLLYHNFPNFDECQNLSGLSRQYPTIYESSYLNCGLELTRINLKDALKKRQLENIGRGLLLESVLRRLFSSQGQTICWPTFTIDWRGVCFVEVIVLWLDYFLGK